jgi:hypothetical protein
VIINNRLKKWSLKNDKITDAQFGFKTDYSTVDIFILHSLIEQFINGKKKPFCCFIDFELCVKHVKTLSDFSVVKLGLFQWKITSLIMFSFYLNDIENL